MCRLVLNLAVLGLLLGVGCLSEEKKPGPTVAAQPAPEPNPVAPVAESNSQIPVEPETTLPQDNQKQGSAQWKPGTVAGLGITAFALGGGAIACFVFDLKDCRTSPSNFRGWLLSPYVAAKGKIQQWSDTSYVRQVNHQKLRRLIEANQFVGTDGFEKIITDFLDASKYERDPFQKGYDALYGKDLRDKLQEIWKQKDTFHNDNFHNRYQRINIVEQNKDTHGDHYAASMAEALVRAIDSLETMSKNSYFYRLYGRNNPAKDLSNLNLFLRSYILVHFPE